MALSAHSALLEAVAARLITALGGSAGLPASAVGVMDDGQPPPNAGGVFVAVWDGGERADGSRNKAHALSARMSVRVTLTVKLHARPADRAGRDLITKAESGVLDRAAEIRDALHGQYPVVGAANVLMGNTSPTDYGFAEPLLFSGRTAVEAKGPGWFWSAAHADTNPQAPAGLATTLTFADALFEKPVAQTL